MHPVRVIRLLPRHARRRGWRWRSRSPLPLQTGAQAAPERTGRLLVTLDKPQSTTAAGAQAAAAVLAHDGVRRDGAQVPQLGLVSVRPTGGQALSALARTLRGQPGVRSVDVEHRYTLRYVPNDPALTAPEVSAGTPPGTPLAWWVARSDLPAAWDIARGDNALVAVIDTGVDAGHPDLAGKVAESIDNDAAPGHAGPMSDENGHGTHVATLACGAGDNGYGVVGAGFNCRLLVIKSDLSDGSVARSIVQAADLGADAINMSFGTDGSIAPARAIVEAINYAVSKDAVLVAAASDSPVEEQGDPANLLQPPGTAQDITAGRGLTVTAANFAGQRAPFAGRGSEISLAAYGAFDEHTGPAGIFSGFPANTTELETRRRPAVPVAELSLPRDVQRRHALRLPRGDVDGRADGRGRRRDGPPRQPRRDREGRHPRAEAERVAARRHRLERPSWDGGSSTPRRRSTPCARSTAGRRSPSSPGARGCAARVRSRCTGAGATGRLRASPRRASTSTRSTAPPTGVPSSASSARARRS